MRAPLVEVSGFVTTPPAEVARKLLGQATDVVDADATESGDRRTVAYQGGWWYRGEYTLEPEGQGTRVTLRVYNIATRARWAVPVANRFFVGFPQKVRASFADQLRSLTA